MHHRVLEANHTNEIVREYSLHSTCGENLLEEYEREFAFQSAKHKTSSVSNSTFFNYVCFTGAASYGDFVGYYPC